jgi:hypothetical protein
MRVLTSLADYALQKDGRERVFLLLFQNNTELRPGGGYIGSFGILKVRDGQVVDFAVHDTNIFDGRVPSTVAPPYPMRETLRIDSWKMRDSNWSPDFPTNARQAETFYLMGGGGEHFDAVIGVTTQTLDALLRLTGPIEIPGYPGVYQAGTVVDDLQYQVEQGWWQQGMEMGERKSIVRALGEEILRRVQAFDLGQKKALFTLGLDLLARKDIQIYFKDEAVQSRVALAHWDGALDTTWTGDSLGVVDANLSALKTDRMMERSIDYTVDLTGDQPRAMLLVTYHNTATTKDWRTSDYQSYLRVYVPTGSWLERVEGAVTTPRYADELGRRSMGVLVQVPLGSERTVRMVYTLPAHVAENKYRLQMTKQAGVNSEPFVIHIRHKDGTVTDEQGVLDADWTLGE